jgi:hypothetical protein
VLQNEDEQNYIMDEVMGLAGVDGDAVADCTEHVDPDEIVGDGMVRLACGNNLLRSEPTLLRQRLKVYLTIHMLEWFLCKTYGETVVGLRLSYWSTEYFFCIQNFSSCTKVEHISPLSICKFISLNYVLV